jgi:hypothetical protein
MTTKTRRSQVFKKRAAMLSPFPPMADYAFLSVPAPSYLRCWGSPHE